MEKAVSIRSRRERPAKPALSREGIIGATIEIMRAEGLEKATLRRVAQALDTGASSLYVYVANTTELHNAVLDELIGTLEVGADGNWQTRLENLLTDYTDVLFTYPGLARSAVALRPAGPSSLRLFDRVLGLLLEGGIEPARASWGADLLLQYVTATAAEHSTPAPTNRDHLGENEAKSMHLTSAIRSADPQALPHLTAHAGSILGGTPAERISWSIRALLTGISATPTPDTHHDAP